MSTPYIIFRESLASVRAGVRLVGTATVIESFTVLQFPPATTAFLRLGQSGQQIPVIAGMSATGLCEVEGLWLDVPVIGAGEIVGIVFTGAGAITLGT